MGAPLSGYYQLPELDIKMPGHDHSLRKLYTIEGLSNPSMVLQLDLSRTTERRLPVRGFSTHLQHLFQGH